MSTIIVSADYFGHVIQSIREKGKITSQQLQHLLGCGGKQLHRYEQGKDLIPRDTLKRIIKYAVKMDMALDKE
ncbi:helix-turn-helix transcriptional regulator [bacterium]|nr:helix-turn-helix transcriptional regulator [bacterium]